MNIYTMKTTIVANAEARNGKRNKKKKGWCSNALDSNSSKEKESDCCKLARKLAHQRWELVRDLVRAAQHGKTKSDAITLRP